MNGRNAVRLVLFLAALLPVAAFAQARSSKTPNILVITR